MSFNRNGMVYVEKDRPGVWYTVLYDTVITVSLYPDCTVQVDVTDGPPISLHFDEEEKATWCAREMAYRAVRSSDWSKVTIDKDSTDQSRTETEWKRILNLYPYGWKDVQLMELKEMTLVKMVHANPELSRTFRHSSQDEARAALDSIKAAINNLEAY